MQALEKWKHRSSPRVSYRPNERRRKREWRSGRPTKKMVEDMKSSSSFLSSSALSFSLGLSLVHPSPPSLPPSPPGFKWYVAHMGIYGLRHTRMAVFLGLYSTAGGQHFPCVIAWIFQNECAFHVYPRPFGQSQLSTLPLLQKKKKKKTCHKEILFSLQLPWTRQHA